MVKRAVELEGTVTGEHGVGLIKRDYLEHEIGKSTVDTMRRVSFYISTQNPYITLTFCCQPVWQTHHSNNSVLTLRS